MGIDVWDTAIESYRTNFPHHTAVCVDIATLSPQECSERFLQNNHKNIDVIVGGPPCQGFSMAGKRQTNDPRNSLFMEFVKYLDFFQPKLFVMENVMGILSMKIDPQQENVKAIDIIVQHLSKDYICLVSKLYASDFEVPQNRRRVLIIGVHKRYSQVKELPEIKPFLPKPNLRPAVRSCLQDRSEIEPCYFLSVEALEGIRKKKERMIKEKKGFGAQYLNLDKPSFTIPARYWKDGYDALVKYSDTEIRRLTVLELKRIQTFPDTYSFAGSKKDQIIQIGNAVACRFAYHIGNYIASLLDRLDDTTILTTTPHTATQN
jgi:DNA (cytosine-5)-methyltransferase 1